MLDSREFGDALRLAVQRSGLADGRGAAEAGYVSLAGTILEYLKANLEITVPAEALPPAPDGAPARAVRCTVS